MNSKDTGGPAFPHPQGWRRDPWISDGMTLRDYFAAAVLSSLCEEQKNLVRPDLTAKIAYKMADAMLAERVKE